MSQCPHCEATENQTPYGRTMRGNQRYKCHACVRVCTPQPLPLSYPEETRREAVRLYLEGVDFRRIGRILAVNHQLVVNWVNAYHAALPASEPPAPKPDVLEMDELFTFISSKKRPPTSSLSLTARRARLSRGRNKFLPEDAQTTERLKHNSLK